MDFLNDPLLQQLLAALASGSAATGAQPTQPNMGAQTNPNILFNPQTNSYSNIGGVNLNQGEAMPRPLALPGDIQTLQYLEQLDTEKAARAASAEAARKAQEITNKQIFDRGTQKLEHAYKQSQDASIRNTALDTVYMQESGKLMKPNELGQIPDASIAAYNALTERYKQLKGVAAPSNAILQAIEKDLKDGMTPEQIRSVFAQKMQGNSMLAPFASQVNDYLDAQAGTLTAKEKPKVRQTSIGQSMTPAKTTEPPPLISEIVTPENQGTTVYVSPKLSEDENKALITIRQGIKSLPAKGSSAFDALKNQFRLGLEGLGYANEKVTEYLKVLFG